MENIKTTIVLFSGNLDKVIAAFIANGASAYNQEITIFTTFGD